MKVKIHLLSALILTAWSVFSVASVKATLTPDFPSCSAPQGTLKVSYSSGSHGIPGQTGELTGSDAVYIVTDSRLIQCFCAPDNSGIQTNWWMVEDLSPEQIQTYHDQGWIYIPSGTPWGLNSSPYLARNLSYTCGSSTPTFDGFSAPGPGSPPVCDSAKPKAPVITSVVRRGGSATITWTAVEQATHYTISYGLSADNYVYGVPNTGNVTSFTINALDPARTYYFSVRAVNNCMPSDPSGWGGQVLGASTKGGLVLAATGNSVIVIGLLGFSALMLMLSALSYRKNRE